MTTCFVPGCKSGSKAQRKMCKNEKVKVPSFFKPLNISMLEKWRNIIPRTNREMRMTDRICELHFEKKYIKRYFEHKMPDGSTFRLERSLMKLFPDAIPTIFSDCSNGISNSELKEVCNIATVAEPIIKKNLEKIENQEQLNLGNKNCIDINEESFEILGHSINVKRDLSFEVENYQNICQASNVIENNSIQFLSFPTLAFDFNYLINNLNQVKKPSASWTISFICDSYSKYVICAVWKNYLVEKRIIIDTLLNVKVFLKEKQVVRVVNDKVNCIEDINKLLQNINYYDLCLGIDNGVVNCLQFIDQRFHDNGRRYTWCDECRERNKQSRIRKKIRREKEKFEKKCQKYSLLCKRYNTVRKQNYMLTKRVERLKTKLKHFKDFS